MSIKGFGPRNAKIVIVGEAFGANEERTGIPFSGPAGHILDKMLIRAGINRRECYVTNVINMRPPKNNFGCFYLDKSRKKPNPLLIAAIEFLKDDIKQIRPNVIIALGGEALKALTGNQSIEKWRGTVQDTEVGKVIATYHPAYILRMYKKRSIAELDLTKARRESHTREVKRAIAHFIVNPTFDAVMFFFHTRHKTLSFDIETTGEHTRCLGFAWSREDAICIPFMKGGKNYWSIDEEKEILKRLDILFKDEGIKKIAQNFPFDSTILAQDFGFEIKGLKMDTMIAQHCCYCEMPKSLNFLASIYTDIPYWKSYDVTNDESTWVYNCWDCVSTYWVAEELEKEMKELEVFNLYNNHCQPLMLALTKAGNRGVLVDVERREKQKNVIEKEIEEIEQKFKSLNPLLSTFNPRSPKQVKDLLYGILKMKPVISRATHSETSNEEALIKLKVKYPQFEKVINLLLSHREKAKLLDAFLQSKLNKESRLQTSYNAAGTVNGRINSQKTIFGMGANLQQIPRGEFRRMFIAPKGKILIKADLSQADARAVAWFAQITAFVERFQDIKFDIHKWNAALVYGKPENEITKEERQKTKALVHGANYGLGPRQAAVLSGFPYAKAKASLDLYKRALPQLEVWHEWIKEEIIKCRRLRTPFGRLRIFMDRLDDALFRSGYAFLPQSLVGDITNRAFFLLDQTLPKDAFLVLQVHDEIVCESLEKDKDLCIELMKKAFYQETIIPPIQTPLIIPVEISTGYNWHDMTKV